MKFELKDIDVIPPAAGVFCRENSVFYSYDYRVMTEFKFFKAHFENKKLILGPKLFSILNTSDEFIVKSFSEEFPKYKIDKLSNIKQDIYQYSSLFSTYLVRRK